jgi:hypothetical protein
LWRAKQPRALINKPSEQNKSLIRLALKNALFHIAHAVPNNGNGKTTDQKRYSNIQSGAICLLTQQIANWTKSLQPPCKNFVFHYRK